MIRIKFEEGQGLGNQLWLFSATKSISEKLNYKLEIENFDKFKGLDFLDFTDNINIALGLGMWW